jgi:hypothetical protein
MHERLGQLFSLIAICFVIINNKGLFMLNEALTNMRAPKKPCRERYRHFYRNPDV